MLNWIHAIAVAAYISTLLFGRLSPYLQFSVVVISDGLLALTNHLSMFLPFDVDFSLDIVHINRCGLWKLRTLSPFISTEKEKWHALSSDETCW